MDEFCYRDVTVQDKAEILEFTANTWDFGDYLSFVFDDWLADPSGLFLVLEEVSTGRIAGLDKLTLLSPHEAWFEGLRIREEYRGRGLATKFQRHMIGEARRLGARKVRFITRAGNTAILLAGLRDGFSQIGMLRGFNWSSEDERPTTPPEAYALRKATPDESKILYSEWRTTSAYRSMGLVNRSWQLAQTREEQWVEAAQQGRLLVKGEPPPTPGKLPTPCLMVLEGSEKEDNAWTLSALSAADWELVPLFSGLLGAARERGLASVEGLLPDYHMINKALVEAGLRPHKDDVCHVLFELDLGR